ncbi:DUF6779 domain-containing protein [Blastococcus saxobsidens]|uniref:DUF6779 domain-containing protein n=1 Tax=Blastococcus saxobsidens (strain DD2) TaxID=1146883 RepID=H6RPX4_BLASD|nr:DUF6779 domain-containing protein [Blastococcus saxobsidens]CCG01543.1 protein of unknown function; putative coiled-coil domains [Blastococcus saxobsidens DD2]
MPRREDDDVDRGPAAPGPRMLLQAGGFVLAVGATLAVLLTDDAQLLKIAVVAVAWAFVLATFAAGRGGADRVRAAAREADLRRAYERELEREVAARREFELELENELRRETEGAMRGELQALRGDIAALADLRDEVARVSSMRGDLAALGGLRDEVARVAALRDDVAALTGMRSELEQLAALREDMGRLRAELAEQLSSEMLVERVVMRTQASRLPGEGSRLDGPARVLDGGAPWSDEAPPRELTGGWPAIRLDEPREVQQFEQVRTSTWSAPAPPVTTAFPATPRRPAPPRPAHRRPRRGRRCRRSRRLPSPSPRRSAGTTAPRRTRVIRTWGRGGRGTCPTRCRRCPRARWSHPWSRPRRSRRRPTLPGPPWSGRPLRPCSARPRLPGWRAPRAAGVPTTPSSRRCPASSCRRRSTPRWRRPGRPRSPPTTAGPRVRTPRTGWRRSSPRTASARPRVDAAGGGTGRTGSPTTSWRGSSAGTEPDQRGPRDSPPPSSTRVWPVTHPAPSPSR